MNQNRWLRVFVPALAVLAVPLLAMQLSDEVQWGVFDFVIVGALLIGASAVYEFGIRRVTKPVYRVVLSVALALTVLLIWAELAVGIFGSPFGGN